MVWIWCEILECSPYFVFSNIPRLILMVLSIMLAINFLFFNIVYSVTTIPQNDNKEDFIILKQKRKNTMMLVLSVLLHEFVLRIKESWSFLTVMEHRMVLGALANLWSCKSEITRQNQESGSSSTWRNMEVNVRCDKTSWSQADTRRTC